MSEKNNFCSANFAIHKSDVDNVALQFIITDQNNKIWQ